jgi:hypothetical protein
MLRDFIFQLLGQLTLNQRVQGSSPNAPTNPLNKIAEKFGELSRRIRQCAALRLIPDCIMPEACEPILDGLSR